MKLLKLLSIFVVIGCGVEKKDSSPVQAPQALSLAGFESPLFLDVPQNEKCKAIESFLNDFTVNHLNEVNLEFSSKCGSRLSFDAISYSQPFTLSKKGGDSSINFTLEVRDYSDRLDYQLSWKEGIGSQSYVYRSEDDKVSPILKHLTPTLKKWIEHEELASTEATIFGKNYFELVDSIVKSKSLNAGSKVEVSYLNIGRFGYNQVKGNLEVAKIDESVLKEGFLGCFTKECLDEGDLEFVFKGDYLVLKRFISENEGVELRSEKRYRLRDYSDFIVE